MPNAPALIEVALNAHAIEALAETHPDLPSATRSEALALLDCQEALAHAVLVGRWIWVTFPSKPAPETRTFLKSRGYHWNTQRNAWQNACAYQCRRAPYDPRVKYGTEKMDEIMGVKK